MSWPSGLFVAGSHTGCMPPAQSSGQLTQFSAPIVPSFKTLTGWQYPSPQWA
jgi:hypothetical protein